MVFLGFAYGLPRKFIQTWVIFHDPFNAYPIAIYGNGNLEKLEHINNHAWMIWEVSNFLSWRF